MTASTLKTSKFIHSSALRSMALASIVSLAATAPAWSGTLDSNATKTEKVSYADLDLSRPEGAKALYRRIQGAARSVCGGEPALDLGQRRIWQDCYNNAVADAVAKVNNPLLTAEYEHRHSPSRIAMLR